MSNHTSDRDPPDGTRRTRGDVPRTLKAARVLAVVLTVLVTGWGHAYAGRLGRGVAWFAGSVLVAMGAAFVFVHFPMSLGSLVAWGAMALAMKVAAASDAVRSLPIDGMVRPAPTRMRIFTSALLFIAAGELAACSQLAWVAEGFVAPSDSMFPTVLTGEHFFVDHTRKRLERGEVVFFVIPGAPKERQIKRIIALAGERVEVHGGRPTINGVPVPSCVLGHAHLPAEPPAERGEPPTSPQDGNLVLERLGERLSLAFDDDAASLVDPEPVTVPEGKLFLLGDNRDRSHDSRAFGPISEASVQGNPIVVWLFGAGNSGEYGRIGASFDAPHLPASLASLEPELARCRRQLAPR